MDRQQLVEVKAESGIGSGMHYEEMERRCRKRVKGVRRTVGGGPEREVRNGGEQKAGRQGRGADAAGH